ncbi:hypothetical protein BGX31_001872 [Mortierella sp. GBA43]|nr:hypothetical protein BGX31_001872 [Mortierella sp. GBA43]
MNPASWRPFQATSIRGVAIATSMASPIRASVRSGAVAGQPTTPCTNTVRKTLTNVHYRSGISAQSSRLDSSRFNAVIRRGFADQSASKAGAGASPSSTVASSTTTSSSSSTVSNAAAKKSSGFMDKIKHLIKQYGYTGVAVYLGVSCVDLAATFVIVKAAGMDKIEQAQDWVVDHVGKYFGYKHDPNHHHPHTTGPGADGEVDLDKVDDEQVGAIYNKASGLWSVFVIAYGIHKLLVPLRVVATSMITPPLVKWLVKKGWIKAVAKQGAVTAGAVETSAAATTAASAANKL